MSTPPLSLAVDATTLGPARTGIENFVHHLLPPLAAAWAPGELLLFARHPELVAHAGPSPRVAPGGGRLWTQFRLAPALRRQRAAVFFNPIPILPLVMPLPCPAVVTVHDLHEFRRRWRYVRVLLRRTFDLAAAVIAVSEATRQELLEAFPGLDAKVKVVHEGADAAVFHPGPATAGLLERHGVTRAPLLAVGTIQPRKNYARMIRAYARLAAADPPPLVIVGGAGWEAEEVLALPGALGIADRVVFTGHLADSELGDLMRASLMLLALSTGEGFGLPVLEAMYTGLPILASDIPPFREVAGNAARFVDPRDEAAIAARLQGLLANPGERAEMAAAGLGRRQLFTWERTAAGIVEVLRGVAANHPLTRSA